MSVVTNPNDSLPIKEFASLFAIPEDAIRQAIEAQRYRLAKAQAFYSIRQLAERWSVSVPQIYKILQADNAKVLNVGGGSKRKKALVPAEVVARLERARMEKMG